LAKGRPALFPLGSYDAAMEPALLLIDDPLDGPANMGRDEALLRSCGPRSPIILRFYAWSPPTISLGYFQDYDDYEKLPPPAGSLAVVRRTTGGGAILHDREVTYSITMPIRHRLVEGRPYRLYELAHEAIIAAIGGGARLFGTGLRSCGQSARRGPFFCFERRHDLDVVIDDHAGGGLTAKIAGSAQRRTAQAILQHGSIILDSRFPQQRSGAWTRVAGPITFGEAVRRLVPTFERSLGIELRRSDWNEEELRSAAIHAASRRWTMEREADG